MSAIAGIVYTDGRPARADELAPALRELAPLGPDGSATWADGSAALGHLALHTTPEAEHERWPLAGERGEWLVADARLDNRDELLRALRLAPRADRPVTDAELILAAHERWGDDAPARLVGDFAYALWRPAARVLRLVRSPFGLKGLFFRVEPQRIVFATTMQGVRALAPEGLTVNLPWLASVLTAKMERLFEETVFHEIAKLPSAHWIRFELEGGQRRERFWALPHRDEYAGWRDAEWVEGFRDCFETVVAAALRSHRPLSIALSGGFDSSSIALVAHRLMHDAGRLPPRPVHALTNRMAGWPDTDESVYRDAVVARLPHFQSRWLELRRAWTWPTVEAWQRHTSAPVNLPNAFFMRPRLEAARAEGCRVMLNGLGGDILTGEEDYFILDALFSLPPLERLREWPYFTHGSLRGAKGFFRGLARRVLPPPLASLRLRRPPAPREGLYSDAAEALARWKAPPPPPVAEDSPLQRFLRSVLFSPLYLQGFEQGPELHAIQGMECRCPFYDRRLVEMLFHLPPHLRFHRGETRVLLRRALHDDLPPALLARRTKAGFARFTAESIAAEDRARANALPPEAFSRQQGWINLPLWKRWAEEPDGAMETIFMHRTAHLENWLTQLGITAAAPGTVEARPASVPAENAMQPP